MMRDELDLSIQPYAAPVIQALQTHELSLPFQDCSQLLAEHIQSIPAWQIALPVISCLAVGGAIGDGTAVAAAWQPMYLASDILDHVEDKELIPDNLLTSPEVATNLATSLIFISFQALAAIPDQGKASRASRIFSGSGFQATVGQHQDLTSTPTSVEKSLDQYWEMIILKSGSVLRMATEAGAAVGTSDDALVETLGDYGTALGVMLQLIDDCRDAFSSSSEAVEWEVSLPILLYSMIKGEENIIFPKAASRSEWRDLLKETGVIHAISMLLLEWKTRALASLAPLNTSREKRILEKLPSMILERIPLQIDEAADENPA